MPRPQQASRPGGFQVSDMQPSETSGLYEALRAVAAYGESDSEFEEEGEVASLVGGDDDGGQRRETGRARWTRPGPLDLGAWEGSQGLAEQGAEYASEGSFDKLALAVADVLRMEPSLVTQDGGSEEEEAKSEADNSAEDRREIEGVAPSEDAEAEGDGPADPAEHDGAANSDMELVEMLPNCIRIGWKHSEGEVSGGRKVSEAESEGEQRPERRSESGSRGEDGISRPNAAASGGASGDSRMSAAQACSGGGLSRTHPDWQPNPLFGIPATGDRNGAGPQAPTTSGRRTSGSEELGTEDGPGEYFGPHASWDEWDERYRQQLLSTGNGAGRDFSLIDQALDSCRYHRSSLPPAPSSSQGLSGFFVGREADPLEGRRGPPRDSTGRPFRPSPSSRAPAASESTASQGRIVGGSADEASSAKGKLEESNDPATDSARLQELEAEMERVEAALAKMRESPDRESDDSENDGVGVRMVGDKTESEFEQLHDGERGTDEVVAKAQRKISGEEPGAGRTGAAEMGRGFTIGEKAHLAPGLVSGEAPEETNDEVTWGTLAAESAGKASQAAAGVNRLPYKLPSGKKGLPKSPLSGSTFAERGALSVLRQADRRTGSAGGSAEGASGKRDPAIPASGKSEEREGLGGSIAGGSPLGSPGAATVGPGGHGAGEAEEMEQPDAPSETDKGGEGTTSPGTDGRGKGTLSWNDKV